MLINIVQINPTKLAYICNELSKDLIYLYKVLQLQVYRQSMADHKGMQILDKMTRQRVFSSRYWREQCFALNAQSFIDKAIQVKYIGGLYSGAKKPTKFLCLVFKLLQMNIQKQIAVEYLKARDYKYLNAIALLYLRLILKGAELYETLQPFYNDNRKLRLRNSIGEFSIIYIDDFVDKLLRDEIVMGISFPFLIKRSALQQQGLLQPRVSLLQQQQQDNHLHQNDKQLHKKPQQE